LGTHRTDWSDPVYNFERFRLIGWKAAARGQWSDLTHRLMQLRGRLESHGTAPLVGAMLAGVLEHRDGDGLDRFAHSPGWSRWNGTAAPAAERIPEPFQGPAQEGYRLGLGATGNPEPFVVEHIRSRQPRDWLRLAGYAFARLGERPGPWARARLARWEGYLE